MDKILVLDPGNSTGWVFKDGEDIIGGTIGESHFEVASLIQSFKPNLIVYETFQLYPGKAQKMCWNNFYPVEVIGVIKYVASTLRTPIVGLQPAVKKYVGTLNWRDIKSIIPITEHTRDAYRLLRYYMLNYK